MQVIDADEDCNLNPVFHTKHSAAIINRLGINDITGQDESYFSITNTLAHFLFFIMLYYHLKQNDKNARIVTKVHVTLATVLVCNVDDHFLSSSAPLVCSGSGQTASPCSAVALSCMTSKMSSGRIRFEVPQAQQKTAKADHKLVEKRNQLKSMKYNQR